MLFKGLSTFYFAVLSNFKSFFTRTMRFHFRHINFSLYLIMVSAWLDWPDFISPVCRSLKTLILAWPGAAWAVPDLFGYGRGLGRLRRNGTQEHDHEGPTFHRRRTIHVPILLTGCSEVLEGSYAILPKISFSTPEA